MKWYIVRVLFEGDNSWTTPVMADSFTEAYQEALPHLPFSTIPVTSISITVDRSVDIR